MTPSRRRGRDDEAAMPVFEALLVAIMAMTAIVFVGVVQRAPSAHAAEAVARQDSVINDALEALIDMELEVDMQGQPYAFTASEWVEVLATGTLDGGPLPITTPPTAASTWQGAISRNVTRVLIALLPPGSSIELRLNYGYGASDLVPPVGHVANAAEGAARFVALANAPSAEGGTHLQTPAVCRTGGSQTVSPGQDVSDAAYWNEVVLPGQGQGTPRPPPCSSNTAYLMTRGPEDAKGYACIEDPYEHRFAPWGEGEGGNPVEWVEVWSPLGAQSDPVVPVDIPFGVWRAFKNAPVNPLDTTCGGSQGGVVRDTVEVVRANNELEAPVPIYALELVVERHA